MLSIRPLRPEDAPALTALARAAKSHWGYPASALAAWRDELAIPPEASRRPSAVAERDGAIAGFYTLAPAEGGWELDNLWVDPGAMREGIGRALLEHALAAARSLGALCLQVDADPHAAPFYLACGARLIGSKPAPIEGDPGRRRPQLIFDLPGS